MNKGEIKQNKGKKEKKMKIGELMRKTIESKTDEEEKTNTKGRNWIL